MIVTKEQQEEILFKYIEDKHNQDECSGFIDGINATIELIDSLLKKENKEKAFCKCGNIIKIQCDDCSIDEKIESFKTRV